MLKLPQGYLEMKWLKRQEVNVRVISGNKKVGPRQKHASTHINIQALIDYKTSNIKQL